jgi:hypothetical protein
MICIEHIFNLLWSAAANVPLQTRRPTRVLTCSLKASKFLRLHSPECITYLVCLMFHRVKTL